MRENLRRKYNLHIGGNPAAAETLVFAHGYGSNQEAWRFITPAFEDRYRLILFDLVGCGGSDYLEFSPSMYASLHRYADDLLQICDALGLRQTHLIAHSVSSMIGALAALKHPEFFASLICIGASPRYLDDEGYVGGFSKEALAEIEAQMIQRYLDWAQGFAATVVCAPDQPEVVSEFARSLSMMRPDIAICIANQIFLSDHRQDVARLHLPVLLLQSRADPVVPVSVSEYLHHAIAGSRLHWLDASGHFPHLTSPAEVVAMIAEHLFQAGNEAPVP